MVEIGKAKEGSYVIDFGQGWPGSDAIKFNRVHGKLTRFHNHSKIFYFRDVELAFFEFEMEVKLRHLLEDTTSSFCMGLWVGKGNEEVIHIDDEPSFSDHVLKGVVHELLECGRGVTETKEHNGGFKESFVHDKGHLPLVAILDVDVIVPPMKIKLSEVVSIFQLVHEVGDERERVGVVDSMFIEVAVVLARAKFAIFLLDEEEREGLGGVRWLNLSCR